MNSRLALAPYHITQEHVYVPQDAEHFHEVQQSTLHRRVHLDITTRPSKPCSPKTPTSIRNEQCDNSVTLSGIPYIRRTPLQAPAHQCHPVSSHCEPYHAAGSEFYCGTGNTWTATLAQQSNQSIRSLPGGKIIKVAEDPAPPFEPDRGFPLMTCSTRTSHCQHSINETKLRELRPALARDSDQPTNIDMYFSIPGDNTEALSSENQYTFPPGYMWAGNDMDDTIGLSGTYRSLAVQQEDWEDWDSHFCCTPGSSFSSVTSDLSSGSVKAETAIFDESYVPLDLERSIDNPRSSCFDHISPVCISEAASTSSSNIKDENHGRERRTGSKGASQRSRSKDAFLIECKRAGMSYKDIKEKGSFSEAESTLRGRFRTLTKRKEQRVRKPGWQENDLRLLQEAVSRYVEPPRAVIPGQDTRTPKISWKQVGEYIWENGGSYHFGNATCKKKWVQMQQHLGLV